VKSKATQHFHIPTPSIDEDDGDTTTMRVKTSLRNRLRTLAVLQRQTLRSLHEAILEKHLSAFEIATERKLVKRQQRGG